MQKLKKATSILAALCVSITMFATGLTVSAVDVTIAAARAQAVGTTATVVGTVTKSIQSSASKTNNNTIFIQEDVNNVITGIAVYKSNSFSASSYAPGTQIRVTGVLTLYNGLLELIPSSLSNISVVSTGTVPAPQDVTVTQLNTGAYQGELVKVAGATLTSEGTSSNHTISQNGVSTTLRCTGSTNLPSYSVGNNLDVTGVAGMYSGAAQLLVQSEADISTHVAVGPAVQLMSPSATTADATPTISINYSATAPATINLSTVQLYVDNTLVSGTVSATGVTYTPTTALSTGSHTARIVVTDSNNKTTDQSFSFSVVAPTAISTARAQAAGTTVTVQGVVTKSIQSSASNATNNTIFIEDTTGGIGVYKSSSFNANSYAEGTILTVTGAVSVYNGLVEVIPASLSDIEVVGTQTKLAPLEITAAQLNTGAYQGKLVKIVGATLTAVATNSNHTIAQNGANATLRCTGAATLTNFVAGDIINAVGIAGDYNGTAQLLVKSESDISAYTSAAPVVQFVNPPATTVDTTPTISINYTATAPATIDEETIQLYVDDTAVYDYTPHGTGVTYTPTTALTTGSHTVRIVVSDTNGQTADQSFTFTVVAPTAISTARGLTAGTITTVQGVVTKSIQSSASNANNNTIFIQDGTGAIGVYKSSSFNFDSYTEGTTIAVTGAISVYNGLVEIIPASVSDIEVVSTGAALTPRDTTIAELNTGNFQGQLIRIVDATLTTVATNSNHTITQNGVTTTMRCTGSATLSSFVAGDIIDVVGIAGDYNGTAQILVKSESDISK